MKRNNHEMIVRLPKALNRWMGIDELKELEVEVRMIRGNDRTQKVGRFSLTDLMKKTR